MSTPPPPARRVLVAHAESRRPRPTWAHRATLLARLALASFAAASLAWTLFARVSPELSVARLSQLLQSLHP